MTCAIHVKDVHFRSSEIKYTHRGNFIQETVYFKGPTDVRKFKFENNILKWLYLAQNSVRGGDLVDTAVKPLVA
jgi:hypothetical protein